jgi:hypothetical protein
MNTEERFQAYAADFELSYVDDDWSRLARHFTADASYDSGDGSEAASGRDAVLQKFQDAVNGLDRAIGQRDVQLHSVSRDGDTVVAEWTARYTRPGLPALEINGTEFARFDGEAIAELRDEISEESLAVFTAWMQAHGGAL